MCIQTSTSVSKILISISLYLVEQLMLFDTPEGINEIFDDIILLIPQMNFRNQAQAS